MNSQRGAALVWVAGVLALALLTLFTLAGWLVALHAAARRELARADTQLLARNAVHLALAELNRGQGYAGAGTPEVQITVTTPGAAAPPASPWYSLDAVDASDWRYVAAVATLGDTRAAAGGTAKAIYRPRFPAGLFATDGLALQDVSTDSYDSRAGDYRRSRDFVNGDLGTFGELRLAGTGRIAGAARPGPGRELARAQGVEVAGRQDAYPIRYAHPLVEGKRQELKPLQVAMGKTTTLSGGVYVADNFMLSDATRLLVEGAVTIYVPGSARIPANALITHSSRALDVTLYVTGGSVELFPPFTGALYAPRAAVEIRGDGEIFGAVTARSIRNYNKLIVHFDRSLPYVTRGKVFEYRLMGWDTGLGGSAT